MNSNNLGNPAGDVSKCLNPKPHWTPMLCDKPSPQIPYGNAATTAKTLTQEEIEEREKATCEIYDEREREWSLLDDGRNPDGTGESYAERNL